MHPPNSRTPFNVPPSSRCSSGDVPLTAERAMIDQIRSKLERSQRRLAHNSPSSSGSIASTSSTYIPSSEYSKPPIKSVLLEDMPATASKQYVSPPATRKPPPSKKQVPPSSSNRRPSSSNRRPPSSKYDTLQSLKYVQYKSKSKLKDADPLNGGPPPMSTPYLVYSSSRPPTTGSSHRDEPSSMHAPPSAMRSGIARPPSSRVRFEGHDTYRESMDKNDRDNQETKRRQVQVKEREIRHQRQQELKNVNAVGRRSILVENPPSSAIKLSAYDEMVQAIPTSPVARQRRSSIGNAPPKSDIKISAFDDVIPRRRSSQEKQSNQIEAIQVTDEAVDALEVVVADTNNNQKVVEQIVEPKPVILVKSSPSSVPEPEELNSLSNEDDGDTSANETDDSYDYEFSDFDTDSEDMPAGYSVSEANRIVVDVHAGFDEENRAGDATINSQTAADREILSPPATELSAVKEDNEEEPQPVSRLTARDLALHALGRSSTCALSDHGSSVPSANKRDSLSTMPAAKLDTSAARSNTPAPMSYTPASSAFPSARALGRRAPATTGRPRNNRIQATSTSVSSYVRRSRSRVPLDLKNHLPPSIGVLSDLSSGSSTFVMNPSYFYEVTWRSGEFAFSVQRVYTEENEYEFDDRNQEPQLFLRMLLNTERSTCKSFGNVRVGDVLIRVGDTYVSDLGLEGSGTVLTKFFAKLMGQTPIKLTFQRMSPSDWEGGVEL